MEVFQGIKRKTWKNAMKLWYLIELSFHFILYILVYTICTREFILCDMCIVNNLNQRNKCATARKAKPAYWTTFVRYRPAITANNFTLKHIHQWLLKYFQTFWNSLETDTFDKKECEEHDYGIYSAVIADNKTYYK